MAERFWEPYLKHVNGETVQANVDLTKINYREFGEKYANLLWSVANSIFDASAEYKIRFESLKLLMIASWLKMGSALKASKYFASNM